MQDFENKTPDIKKEFEEMSEIKVNGEKLSVSSDDAPFEIDREDTGDNTPLDIEFNEIVEFNDVESIPEEIPAEISGPYSDALKNPSEKDGSGAVYQLLYTLSSEINDLKRRQKNIEIKNAHKKKRMFMTFVAFSCILIIIFLSIIAVNLRKSKPAEPVPEGDKTQIILHDTPVTDNKYEEFDGTELSAAQIANRCRKYNVSIKAFGAQSVQGEGSGIIMSRDQSGEFTYIITCAHVINKGSSIIKVTTETEKSYTATLVGYDTKSDIGLLAVKSDKLECPEFGNSEALVIGDKVYAIGNPGGSDFFGSFTAGVVSDINRPVGSESGYTSKCIQHDAAINPGNSGGMLLNKYGQVIGINSQKIASVSYEGMGFAIPISVAAPIINQIIEQGIIKDRAVLGIQYMPITSFFTPSLVEKTKDLPRGSIVISDITNESLSKTGIQKYDIITGVDGKSLDSTEILIDIIDSKKPGDTLKLDVVRIDAAGEMKTLVFTAKLIGI